MFPRRAAPSRSAARLVLRFAPGKPTGQDPFKAKRLALQFQNSPVTSPVAGSMSMSMHTGGIAAGRLDATILAAL
jgi:hypothetical protein